MGSSYRLKIFSDFDGTITKNDVWINALGHFIKDKDALNIICDDLNSQRIGTRETMVRQLELVHNFCLEKFNSYFDEEEIDEFFKEFVDFCQEREYEVNVVSGGLEYYIDYILKKQNISVKYFGCEMIMDEQNKKLHSKFLYTDDYCKSCETCKRNILINNVNDLENEISIYIGDGASDYCVSNFADIIFAKGRLASYCWKNNITYYEYKNFSDIKNKIIKLTEKQSIKQRREATIKRRDVVMGG